VAGRKGYGAPCLKSTSPARIPRVTPVRTLLAAEAGRKALARGRVSARRIVLVGGALIAVTLFLERLGILSVPWVGGLGGEDRILAWFVVSIAGLVQGLLALLALFLLALLVRAAAPLFLKPPIPEVAREIDRVLETDRFSSALEAKGPLAALVERRASEEPPPAALFKIPSRRGERWLRRLVVLLVLLVALVPGKAPAAEGGLVPQPEGGTEEGEVVLRLVGEKEIIPPGLPVPVQVILESGVSPVADFTFPVSIRIDGGEEHPTGATLFLPAGAPGQDAVGLDLEPLTKDLAPGDHVAVARAGLLQSNEYRFRIEGPEGGQSPSPVPKPDANPPPKPPPVPQQQGGGPQETKPKFVEPLVKGDDQVRKKAKVPIEVPEGGGGQQEKPIEEAWPELERRREEALNRPGLSPAARKLVREYFELLRPEGK